MKRKLPNFSKFKPHLEGDTVKLPNNDKINLNTYIFTDNPCNEEFFTNYFEGTQAELNQYITFD